MYSRIGRKRKRMGREMMIPDPLLLSRLNKYLESKKNEVTIDQNMMVEDLRSTYKEYERKDKTAFRASVFRAFNSILQPLVNPSSVQDESDDGPSIESSSNDDELFSEECGDDIQVLDSSKANESEGNKNNGKVSYLQNLQNMTNASGRNNKNAGSTEGDNIERNASPIDISSDDEDLTVAPVLEHPRRIPPLAPAPVLTVTRSYRPINHTAASVILRQHNRLSSSSSPPVKDMVSIKRNVVTPHVPIPKKRRNNLPGVSEVPKLRLKDFGGHHKIAESLSCLMQHLKCPEVYFTLGISPPAGFLLHGPPGSGKTLLAHCIAGELNLPLLKVAGPELVSGISGESEQRIRNLFDSASSSSPCVLFIDEIDAISQPRESASKDMERRIVAQLLASFDDLQNQKEGGLVVVIGATNRADSLDPALRRAGRFDREITVGMPDRQTRTDILHLLCDSLRLSPDLDLDSVAAATPGYVGADLKALTTQAAYNAVERFMKDKEIEPPVKAAVLKNVNKENSEVQSNVEPSTNETSEKSDDNVGDKLNSEATTEDTNTDPLVHEKAILVNETGDTVVVKAVENNSLEGLYIESVDFMSALKNVQPSAKREGFATVPDVTWQDVGSLENIREQLNLSIMMPVKYPEEFAKLGVTSPTGVLLCGPPGCGKTLLAKAVANEANINFISVKGPELLNMYVGESEKAVRQVFQRARNSQPCVIFFDEIDALCPKRSDSSEGGGRAGSRVVNQLLTEMDGVEGGRGGVYMMAATNRPDMVDPAVLRPGRFDKVLYVGLPSPLDRALILKAITKSGTKPEMTDEVDLEAVGCSEKCDGFSGADLAALIKEASVQALSEFIKNDRVGELKVSNKHINSALTKIRPSVSPEERVKYEAYRLLYSFGNGSEEKMEEDD